MITLSTMNPNSLFLSCLLLTGASKGGELQLQATNPLAIARSRETLELTAAQLAPLATEDLRKIHIRDTSGQEILCQAVDSDFDPYHTPDRVVFQADFAPSETLSFTISSGPKQTFQKKDFRVFGRFNRERFDDFAWENDRIAHRTYGQALETWDGEPLISSTIDIWSKRTEKPIINDWYLADDYHADHGEGADFYSAGLSRGCGALGIWASDRLWTSRNFTASRVLANGPIRLIFELDYEPWRIGGTAVSEVKRVTLDAGSQLNHFQSTFHSLTRPDQPVELTVGIGLRKTPGDTAATDSAKGWLSQWEPVSGKNGMQGLAVWLDPETLTGQAEDELNRLVLAKLPSDGTLNYWSGFAWDRAGIITDFAAWQTYLKNFAAFQQSPIEVTLTAP
ncbi:hypothetical protein HNR46_001486 [Haloferula luteola]|uniref:DUF4861 domain-containing protein n=1 Tax=Haloferula luteola TaxID=595692 RepID=A0A840VBD7_9BACT|nr:DUF4861 family protein [Haloferula luteola]MBB5351250.1 hypothetical protein [Haloferula luteola]